MKLPIDWLKEFVDFDEPIKDVSDSLLMSGTEVVSFDDKVIEVDILPNRGDCLSVRGIAREISAILDKKFKEQKINLVEVDEEISGSVSVEVQDFGLCPRYMARVIKDVKIGESPSWLQQRLLSSGIRPINNVVDITNYCMLEFGQPLHAFDLDLIDGKKIIVSKAKNGEKVVTLDGIERILSNEDLIISDAKKTVAIAGVMGCLNSEINPSTKNILIESAFFSPVSINKTSKNLKLRTEASIRFERGVDFEAVKTALDKASSLISQLSGGKCLKGSIDVKKTDFKRGKIILRIDRIKKILGIEVPKLKIVKILENLGFSVKSNSDKFEVEVPSWRSGDIEREIDVIEEIARVNGYDVLNDTFTFIKSEDLDDKDSINRLKKERQLRHLMASCGFYEAKTFSMVGSSLMAKGHIDENSAIKISNPLIEEMTHLRTTLILGLLESAKYNFDRGINDIAIFEIGKVFTKSGAKEKNVIAGLLHGSVQRGIIEKDKINEDFYFIKGIIENIFSIFSICCVDFYQSSDSKIENGLGAEIFLSGEKVGFFGMVNKEISSHFDFIKPVYIFEIDFDKLLDLSTSKEINTDLPKYPAVKRDVAMFIPFGVSHREITETIFSEGGALVEDVLLFDRYEGKGKTSLAYTITYRSKEKTLTDEEVNFVHEKVLSALQNNLNVEIRK